MAHEETVGHSESMPLSVDTSQHIKSRYSCSFSQFLLLRPSLRLSLPSLPSTLLAIVEKLRRIPALQLKTPSPSINRRRRPPSFRKPYMLRLLLIHEHNWRFSVEKPVGSFNPHFLCSPRASDIAGTNVFWSCVVMVSDGEHNTIRPFVVFKLPFCWREFILLAC